MFFLADGRRGGQIQHRTRAQCALAGWKMERGLLCERNQDWPAADSQQRKQKKQGPLSSNHKEMDSATMT